MTNKNGYEYEQLDPETLGTLIAQNQRWDGHAITAAFLAALTDANYHELRNQLQPIINQHLKG